MDQKLLLVDDEENIVRSLVRLLRRDGYNILTANSGKEGLEVLSQNSGIGVIVSDQRMPEMSGVEFLSEVKELYPDTVRIVLSGYTDLNSVTDAINRGAIYKFLTKPWEDDLIRENIKGAFKHFELVKENKRLTEELKHANEMLEGDKKELQQNVREKSLTLEINLHTLQVAQEILDKLPIAVLGIGDDDVIAVANEKAHRMFESSPGALIGQSTKTVMDASLIDLYKKNTQSANGEWHDVNGPNQTPLKAQSLQMGEDSESRGSVVVVMPQVN